MAAPALKRKETHVGTNDLSRMGECDEPTVNTEGRFWCFTVFAVDNSKVPREYVDFPANVNSIIRSSRGTEYPIKYLIYQEEKCPKTDRYHLQGFMITHKPVKFTVLKNCYPKVHLAMRYKKSTNAQAREYCNKDDTATGFHKYEGGEFEEDQSGKRSDLEMVAKAIEDGDTLKAVARKFPSSFMKYHGGIQKFSVLMQEPLAIERINECYWGPGGVGKTHYVMELIKSKGWSFFIPDVKSDGSFCFASYAGEQVLLLDDFEGKKHLDCRTLKLIMDNHGCNLPARYVQVAARHHRVIILSNLAPENWGYGAEHVHPIVRRIDSLVSCRMDEWRVAANPYKNTVAQTVPNPNREYLRQLLLEEQEISPSSSCFILPTNQMNPTPQTCVDLTQDDE